MRISFANKHFDWIDWWCLKSKSEESLLSLSCWCVPEGERGWSAGRQVSRRQRCRGIEDAIWKIWKRGTHHHSVGEETAHPPHYHHHQSLAVAITTTTSEEHTKNILSRDDEETLDFCGGGIPFYMLVETGARNISCSTVDIDFDLGSSSSSSSVWKWRKLHNFNKRLWWQTIPQCPTIIVDRDY